MRRIESPQSDCRLGMIFFPAFDWQISPSHPERSERLIYTRDQIFEEGLMDIEGMEEYNPRLVDFESVKATHICVPGCEDMVTEPHLISAGGAVRAAELVDENEVDKAFALIRPPGHHAFRVVHGARGFCTINNEAIMADWLKRRHPDLRLAFVDTDAHHSDGTQDIFYNDPDVLHISLHQDGRTLFPGSGSERELGTPSAFARTLNLPLPPGTGDEGMIYALENLVLPVLEDFQPDLVINAAGQDNHFSDPITNMNVTARGYGRINELIDPDLAVLQGGYAIESALPYVNMAVILAMAGLDYSGVIEPDIDCGRFSQDKSVPEEVKRSVEKLNESWQKRDQTILTREFSEVDGFYRREKSLHYDTDNIRETGEENFKICPDCPGYLDIVSQAAAGGFSGRRIRAVILPHGVCENCRQEAERKWEELKETQNQSSRQGNFDFIYWQNRDSGSFSSCKL